jgi:hypothetical protein
MTVEQLYKSFCAFCGEQIGFADQPAAVRDEAWVCAGLVKSWGYPSIPSSDH